jgi:hypothetical protein
LTFCVTTDLIDNGSNLTLTFDHFGDPGFFVSILRLRKRYFWISRLPILEFLALEPNADPEYAVTTNPFPDPNDPIRSKDSFMIMIFNLHQGLDVR